MEPAAPESKRPRLANTSSWSTGHTLPQPNPLPHHPPHPSHAGHPPPPPPYHPSHSYSRPPDSPAPIANHHHDDRRHHEPDAYPPMQDHQRYPPPSPAQQAHHHYPGIRDPIVKRDPNEDHLPQLRRPNSTGHPVESLPPTPHAPHHRPVQQPQERQMSYDNGQPMVQSPTGYRPPPANFSVPATPIPHQHPYDAGPYNHGGHAPPPPPMSYHPQLEIQQSSSNKRKATRASQACDSCRQLKAKCDESKPCKTCRERNINCVFRDPQPKQSDKASADIIEFLQAMKDEMNDGFQQFKMINHRLDRLEAAINTGQPVAPRDCKMESIEQEEFQRESRESEQPDHHSSVEDDELPQQEKNGMDVDTAVAVVRNWDPNNFDEKPGPPVAGKTKLPANHTTLAGLLLKWNSIHKLVQRHLQNEHITYVEEFPIRQEKARGLLRVYGSGEGDFQEQQPPAADHQESHQAQNILTDIHDDNSEAQSPVPAPEVWGQTGGLSPAPGVTIKGGVTGMDGNPDFKPSTVQAHVQSFKDNILNMHPVLIPEELDALVTLFLRNLPQESKSNLQANSNPKFIGQPTSAAVVLPEITGAKRKRSPGGDDMSPFMNLYKPGHPFRSITNAIVLLACALGKICSHKERIPDVVTPPRADNNFSGRSPSLRNGGPMSPSQGSPPGYMQQSSGFSSPQDYDRGMPSRRTSLQGNGPNLRPTSIQRNYDVIPGLEYFALATDIMGSHLGGISLKHVYAWILAGLYHGQLARAVESWAYIKQGCTVLQEILRTSIFRFHEIKQSPGYIQPESRRDNQLALAYWTCLQLESDLLAELPLSQSPIMQHEDHMPYPNMGFVTDVGYSADVCASYFAQLHLRRQLNEIHNLLYNPDKSTRPQSPGTIDEGIATLQNQLKSARGMWVPATFRWKDDEPLATDILHARLRAKYWGSQVIIYRPFVRHFLEKEPIPYGSYRDAQPPRPDTFKTLNIELGSKPIPDDVDPRTLNYARLGIEALMESTRAFHGMPRGQRIIVTNVFGTAHAQWGNLLTLAACYQHELLARFVDFERLRELFIRTIEFFDIISHRSSPLKSERNILHGLASDLNFIRPEDPPTSTSFSSSINSTTPVTSSYPPERFPTSAPPGFTTHMSHTSRP